MKKRKKKVKTRSTPNEIERKNEASKEESYVIIIIIIYSNLDIILESEEEMYYKPEQNRPACLAVGDFVIVTYDEAYYPYKRKGSGKCYAEDSSK